ncbi:MAG: hypothetical protein Q4D38_13430 [Planctomycetia bacterium]|nr:hypothetical protein [Planctomycetia bacterium]
MTQIHEKNHYYRFAFIGSTSSGKTCMLAKMANGDDSSLRFSSAKIPLQAQPLTQEELEELSRSTATEGQKAQWRLQKLRERNNLYIGEERLSKAVAMLVEGNVPPPTEPDGRSAVVKFKLCDTEERGDFYVQTEDYAGEYLRVEELRVSDSNAFRFKEGFLEYDGLIIVIETAVTEAQKERVREQIANINQYFSALTENKKFEKGGDNIPVAIILSKWDRYSEIDFNDPNAEREKLERFLSENEFYNTLIKTARSNALEQEMCPDANVSGIVYGKTAVFPVSAFGKSIQLGDEAESPAPGYTQSLNLVEPFYWLATQCDENAVANFENAVKNSCFSFRSANAAKKTSQYRIPRKSERYKRWNAAAWSLFWRIRRRNFCIAALTLFALLIGTRAYFSFQTQKWRDQIAFQDPQAQEEDIIKGLRETKEEILEFEAKWRPLPALLLTTSGLVEQIDARDLAFREKMRELLWSSVVSAPDLAQKAQRASEYLEKYPSDKTRGVEARKFIEENKNKVEANAWQAVLDAEDTPSVQRELAEKYLLQFTKHEVEAQKILALGEDKDEDAFWASVVVAEEKSTMQRGLAEQYLSQFDAEGKAKYRVEAMRLIAAADEKVENDFMQTVRDASQDLEKQKELAQKYLEQFNTEGKAIHRVEAQRLLTEIELTKKWNSAKIAYERTCQSGDCERILNSLKQLVIEFGTSENRCGPFVKEIPGLILENLRRESRNTSPREQIFKCRDVEKLVEQLETTLREKKDTALAQHMLSFRQELAKKSEEYRDDYDKSLYKILRDNPTEINCSTYLKEMEAVQGGAMREVVEGYQRYLEKRKQKLGDVRLTCMLYWGPETPDDTKLRGIITINHKTQYNELVRSWTDAQKPIGKELIIGDAFLNDTFELEISYVSEGNRYNYNRVAYGKYGRTKVRLSECFQPGGKAIRLEADKGYGGGVMTIFAHSKNYERGPVLPVWTK